MLGLKNNYRKKDKTSRHGVKLLVLLRTEDVVFIFSVRWREIVVVFPWASSPSGCGRVIEWEPFSRGPCCVGLQGDQIQLQWKLLLPSGHEVRSCCSGGIWQLVGRCLQGTSS